MNDLPFDECVLQASRIKYLDPKSLIFQKFTCAFCGSRQTMEKEDTFYEEGTCEECGNTTKISHCGFMFVHDV